MASIKPATLRLAREWVEYTTNIIGEMSTHEGFRAIKDVILSLPAPAPPAEIVLGGKAHHARIGEVVIASTKSNTDGQVQVMWANGDVVESDWVSVCDLENVAPNGDKDKAHVEKSVPTPKPGEAWLISIDGEHYEAIVDGKGEFAVSDDRTTVFHDCQDVTPLARLVPETPRKRLVTEEDYRDAPPNTVVKNLRHGGTVIWEKWDDDTWQSTNPGVADRSTDAEMVGIPRTVIWEPEG